MKYLGILVWTIIIGGLLGAAYFVFSGNTDASGLPRYALQSERIKEAYLFAKENPAALEGINCYCGCMQHPHGGRIHARGLLDCFRNGEGFERHGSECEMCINDALQVKHLVSKNKTKEEIKKIIDGKYTKQ